MLSLRLVLAWIQVRSRCDERGLAVQAVPRYPAVIFANMFIRNVYAHIYTHACTHVYTHGYRHVCSHGHPRVCVHVLAHAHDHFYIHVHACVCTCLHTCLRKCPTLFLNEQRLASGSCKSKGTTDEPPPNGQSHAHASHWSVRP